MTTKSDDLDDLYEVFDLHRVLHRLSVAAARLTRLGAITLNLRQPDGRYTVMADTGGKLLGSVTTGGFWAALLRDEHRVGGSYLIPPEHTRSVFGAYPEVPSVVPDLPSAASPDRWDPDHMLIVPLVDRSGQAIGYLSADQPPDGKLPTVELLADMETFAQQAAITVELVRSEERFRSLVQNATDVIAVLDETGTTNYLSPAVERVLGYSPQDRVGKSIFAPSLLHPEDDGAVAQFFAELAATPGLVLRAEFRMRHADGTYRHLEVVGTNLLDDPAVNGIVVNYRDITDRKELEERLRRQAFYDSLTGLPNRALLMDRLQHALEHAARHGETIAVLYLDLDGFKAVNDSLGHEAGDRLLSAMARRLEGCLRAADTPARLGGDEFVVLMESISGEIAAIRLAERITACLNAPYRIDGHEVRVGVNLGVAVSVPGLDGPEQLLRSADVAMYRAKRRRRSATMPYDAFGGTGEG